LNSISDTTIGEVGSDSSQNLLHTAWRRSYAGLWSVGLFSVFINILKLAMPIYLLQVLDRVVGSRSVETLIMLTIIALLAMLTCLLLEVIRRQLFMGWGVWIERTFGPHLFTGLLCPGLQ
jgi:ATP-binding cassette, subfamily C, type I secretion system permease/ATPase